MRALREVVTGLGLAFGSLTFALGALLLSTAEGRLQNPQPSPACTPPAGWQAYSLDAGESLEAVAARSGLEVEGVLQANCLDSGDLAEGSRIYLPPEEQLGSACGPPEGWVLKEIQSESSLSALASAHGTTESALHAANCLSEAGILQAGMRLFVPATATPTALPAPTASPTSTLDLSSPTSTPIPTTAP